MVKKVFVLLLALALPFALFAEDGKTFDISGELIVGFQTDGDVNSLTDTADDELSDVEGTLTVSVEPAEGVSFEISLFFDNTTITENEVPVIVDEAFMDLDFGAIYGLPLGLVLSAGYVELTSMGYNLLSGFEVEDLTAGSLGGGEGWSMGLTLSYPVDGVGSFGVYGATEIDTIGNDSLDTSWMGGAFAELEAIPLNLEVAYDTGDDDYADGALYVDAGYALAFGEMALDLGFIDVYGMDEEINTIGLGAVLGVPLTDTIALTAGITNMLIMNSGADTTDDEVYVELNAEFMESFGLFAATCLTLGDSYDDAFPGMDLGAYVYAGPATFTVGTLIDTVDLVDNPAAYNAPADLDATSFYVSVGLEF